MVINSHTICTTDMWVVTSTITVVSKMRTMLYLFVLQLTLPLIKIKAVLEALHLYIGF